MNNHLKSILYFIFIAWSISCYSQDISGNWGWNYKNGKHIVTIDLTKINDHQFEGIYCSVFYDGNKIDCNENDKEILISLSKISQNIFEGDFKSAAFNGSGKLRITYLASQNSLNIKILSSEGEFYFPQAAIFKK